MEKKKVLISASIKFSFCSFERLLLFICHVFSVHRILWILPVSRTGERRAYLPIKSQSQGESDELGDGVLGCGRVQDQAHLPAPGGHDTPAALTTRDKTLEDSEVMCHQTSKGLMHHKV